MKKPFTFNLSGPLLFVNEATFTTFFGVQNYNFFQYVHQKSYFFAKNILSYDKQLIINNIYNPTFTINPRTAKKSPH